MAQIKPKMTRNMDAGIPDTLLVMTQCGSDIKLRYKNGETPLTFKTFENANVVLIDRYKNTLHIITTRGPMVL